MGANYDTLIVSLEQAEPLADNISRYLTMQGFTIEEVCELHAAKIKGDQAVLLSPPRGGWAQLIANSSGLRVGLPDWFQANPLAGYLSFGSNTCLHLWSLNSGFVAGYSVYRAGSNRESDHLFSSRARRTDLLMPGVPTPPRQPGD